VGLFKILTKALVIFFFFGSLMPDSSPKGYTNWQKAYITPNIKNFLVVASAKKFHVFACNV